MSGLREQRVREIFNACLRADEADARAAVIEEQCAGDDVLRSEVRNLLDVYEDIGSFLDKPLGDVIDEHHRTKTSGDGERTIDESMTVHPGAVIGHYKLLEQIGEGGMGTVFLAEQTEPVERKVALKIIKPGMDSKQVLARFEAERQALALMDHPNIAHVYDAGSIEQHKEPHTTVSGYGDPLTDVRGSGRPYFVMELVEGKSITKYCDELQLTLMDRLRLFVSVCQAVQHAHQKGIIHRDLKPSNILVGQYDGKPAPKIIDFGVAKATGGKLTQRTLFTEYGSIIGTLEYMSPEQAELNQIDIDTRSDVYSLGVVLYELLTGSTPLDHKRVKEGRILELLQWIREGETPKPSMRLSTTKELDAVAEHRHVEPKRLCALMRGELDWIVMKALEKDRNRRYESANAFAEDIHRYLDNKPVRAFPPSLWYRLRKIIRRNRAIATGAGLAVMGLLVALVFLSISVVSLSMKAESERKLRLNQTMQLAKSVHAETNHQFLENGKYVSGFLRLGKCLQIASEVEDLHDLRNRIRQQLGGWSMEVHPLQAILQHKGPVTEVAFSPDGTTVLTASKDHTAKLWNAKSGQLLHTLQHQGELTGIRFTANGTRILTSSRDGTARLWDAGSGKAIGSAMKHDGPVLTIDIRPDGKVMVTGSEDGTARLWSAVDGTPLSEPMKHDLSVEKLAFTYDGNMLVTGETYGVIRRWDASTGQSIGNALISEGRRGAAALIPGKQILFIVGNPGSLATWDVAKGKLAKNSNAILPASRIHAFLLSPDKSIGFVGRESGIGRFFDPIRVDLVGGGYNPITGSHFYMRHEGAIRAAAFHPSGNWILTGSDDGTARMWNVEKQTLQGLPMHHGGPVHAVVFSPDGAVMLTGSEDGTARIWRVSQKKETGVVLDHGTYLRPNAKQPNRCDVRALAWVNQGKQLLTVYRSGWDSITGQYCSARLWYPSTGERVGQPLRCLFPLRTHCNFLQPLVTDFLYEEESIDGNTHRIATTVLVKEVGTGKVIRRFSVPEINPSRAVLNANGTVLALLRDSVKLFDFTTGKPMGADIPYPGRSDGHFVLSPDGKRVACASGHEGYVYVYDGLTGEALVPPLFHRGQIGNMAFNLDGTQLLVVADRRLEPNPKVWHLQSGNFRIIAPPPFTVDDGWPFNGSLTMSGQGPLRNRETGDQITLPYWENWMAFNPSGEYLAGAQGSTVRLYHAPRPMKGDTIDILLRTQAMTGMELNEDWQAKILSIDAWKARKQKLEN